MGIMDKIGKYGVYSNQKCIFRKQMQSNRQRGPFLKMFKIRMYLPSSVEAGEYRVEQPPDFCNCAI